MHTMICYGADGLRVEELDAELLLPQILRLRRLVARRISLAPDAAASLDRHDAQAMHWGVFRGAELVAAARLCFYADLDSLPEANLFDALAIDPSGPIAVMSHCVVRSHVRDLRLEGLLDAARIERVRQLRLGAVLAVSRRARRIAALEAQGFDALGPSNDGRRGLVFYTERTSPSTITRMRVPCRT